MFNKAALAVLSIVLCVTLALGAKSNRVQRNPVTGLGADQNTMLASDGTTANGLTATGGTGAAPRALGLAWPPEHPGKDSRLVAFMAAESAPLATALRDSLEGYGEWVTDVPCVSYTPTFAEMCGYDVILVWSSDSFADPVTMGDRLADYVDVGGRVIMFTSCWYDSAGLGIGGRIKNEWQYQTINYSDSFDLQDRTEGWFDPGHEITRDMGIHPIHMYFRHNTTLAPGAFLLAEWMGGIPFVVVSVNTAVICINCYIGNDTQPTGPSGAWGRLVDNAIEWSSGAVIDNAGDAWVSMTLAPSPFAGAVLRVGYNLTQPGPASVTLFDISGRAAARQDFTAARAGQLSLALRLLSAGVYLVRLDDGHRSAVQKLVVQR
ncbi:MAG: T9SS type A sorting domain-containing protein [candidate division WOR-3 bacterium]|nr:T9SS type A sorting domain-containing protein [candidate division WOR-3 bacterium]